VLNGIGPPGSGVGNNGDFYIDTAADVLYGPKASGAWPPSGTSLVGAPGATGAAGPAGPAGAAGTAGANGNTVLNGTGPPASTLGNDGDFYIDTAADVLYGPKASGAWPTTGTSLVGAAGPAGPQGLPGVGTAGPKGLDTIMVKASETLSEDSYATEDVECPADHPYVLGGGGGFDVLVTTDGGGPYVTQSFPVINGYGGGNGTPAEEGYSNGWAVFAENVSGISDTLTVWAICAE